MDSSPNCILVTGGAGFIGSTLVRHLIDDTEHNVVNLDKLTYAGNLDSLQDVEGNPCHIFRRVDICDRQAVEAVFRDHSPTAVIHLAAESHVDRSIDSAAPFIQTNIVGTFVLLDVARQYVAQISPLQRNKFRFLHVSTDEVYGDIGFGTPASTESGVYAPSSPYAASKASSDHLVRSWHRTYGLPTLITNCTNNFGPYQFPEKLIPLTILNALEGRPLPIYGSGENVRDWLFVDDHVRALMRVLTDGVPGETYNVGACNPMTNLDLVRTICVLLDEIAPRPAGSHLGLITPVADRPGHDLRYNLDPSKLMNELGWRPEEAFEAALRRTICWYRDHKNWCERVQTGSYRRERLGLRAQP